jgi:hypothetical protein
MGDRHCTVRELSNAAEPAVLPRLPVGVALALVAVLVGAVLFLSLPGDKLWQRVVDDAGHGPVFAGIAIVLLLMRSPAGGSAVRTVAQYRDAFLASVALGILTELLQYTMPDRSVSLRDAMHDAGGATLGLACAWLLERWLARRRGQAAAKNPGAGVAIALALAAFTSLAWQPLQCARAYASRAAASPTLFPLGASTDWSFATVHDAVATYGPLPERHRRPDDAYSLRLAFTAGARPGLRVVEPQPDWVGYDVLALDVTNPSPAPARLVLRIFDAAHDWSHADRFNQALVIAGDTRATIRISLETVAQSPRGRRMDLRAVSDVMLFAAKPLDAGALYVSRVWLE